MNLVIQKIIDHIIIKKSFINNYPKSGVVFLNIDHLFNDPTCRKLVSDAVLSAIKSQSFDSVAGIASRGYILSGMIASRFVNVGEQFIQKVKTKDDPNFVQIDTKTEYSSDALQVLRNTVQRGKKYLLTDDLIATGGSVLTAIQLIRQCGGEVDTVFVMTELLDLGAREKLKKEGVELVSLLQFSNQDLQKLLLLQNSYDEKLPTPLIYELTHYKKEAAQAFSLSELFDIQSMVHKSYSFLVLFQEALQHLVQVLSKALGNVNEYIMGPSKSEKEGKLFNTSRLVNLNYHKSKDKYAKRGVFFAPTIESMPSKPIDLYNHGCPVKTWGIAPEKVKRNDFKIFSTGDAFSILSPEVAVDGANITIHVGVDHASHSPLVLLHEALQLCRCTYEHGAKEVTIAIPEQYHPVLHPSDFNLLLMSLFKASGANKIYFYDKTYKGILDETNRNASMPLTLSQHSDPEHYKLSRSDLLDYLHVSSAKQSLDDQVMHFTRKSYLNEAWAKFAPGHTKGLENIYGKGAPAEIKIPEIKVQPHVLLCCSANKPLAEKIAASLRMHGQLVKLYSIEGKGEHANIPKEAEICGALVTIVQSTRPNPDKLAETQEYQINGASSYFFEAAMVARQAQLRGADKINLINPYQFSARSDKAEDNPKGKTGAYVQVNGLLFEAAGVNHVITAECHDAHTMSGSYTGKNIKGSAVQALSVIATRIASEWLGDSSHPMRGQLRLVTPDAGATKRTKELTLQLQSILGKRLCESRILGEKQRDSHQDDSALINSLNSGAIGINPDDKYLITDDETATGNTLCQAITNLKKSGAKDIAVIIIHNNMPLDWLLRQMCLARFLYMGVNDLHFSDTQEMGTLAASYDDLIHTYALKARLSSHEVEEQVFAWFKKNISEDFADNSEGYLTHEFEQFKSTFNQVQSRVKVHSLAEEFANQVKTMPRIASPASASPVYAAAKGTMLFFPHPATSAKDIKGLPANDGTLVCSSKAGH